MKNPVFLLPLILLLEACAVAPTSPAGDAPPTLDNHAIPWAEIESLLNSGQRRTLEGLQSTGYVIMDGWLQTDGSIKIRRVVQSYPDHVRDQLALAYGRNAVVRFESSGSQIMPAIEIYVQFYHTNLEGDIALTFARKRDATGSNSGSYLNIEKF